jgi:hypothetical protein
MFHFQHHQPYPIFCQILKREKKERNTWLDAFVLMSMQILFSIKSI